MPIRTQMFDRNDLPDHLNEEVSKYADLIFCAVAPEMKDAESLNFIMAAINWVSFLCIKEFVAYHHQETAVLIQAKTILNNLETFKDRNFLEEAKKKWSGSDSK